MPSVRDALTAHLERATAMRDDDAVRVLRSALAAIDDDAHEITSGVDTHRAALSIIRREIDVHSRAAGQVATTSPDAAAALRREAEVLTIVLASAATE